MIELPQHDSFATVLPAVAYIARHTAAGYVLERWEYATSNGAHMALASWQARQFEGEPRGWIYHRPSERYRPGGDPGQECHVSPEARLLALSVEETSDADNTSDGGTQT